MFTRKYPAYVYLGKPWKTPCSTIYIIQLCNSTEDKRITYTYWRIHCFEQFHYSYHPRWKLINKWSLINVCTLMCFYCQDQLSDTLDFNHWEYSYTPEIHRGCVLGTPTNCEKLWITTTCGKLLWWSSISPLALHPSFAHQQSVGSHQGLTTSGDVASLLAG